MSKDEKISMLNRMASWYQMADDERECINEVIQDISNSGEITYNGKRYVADDPVMKAKDKEGMYTFCGFREEA